MLLIFQLLSYLCRIGFQHLNIFFFNLLFIYLSFERLSNWFSCSGFLTSERTRTSCKFIIICPCSKGFLSICSLTTYQTGSIMWNTINYLNSATVVSNYATSSSSKAEGWNNYFLELKYVPLINLVDYYPHNQPIDSRLKSMHIDKKNKTFCYFVIVISLTLTHFLFPTSPLLHPPYFFLFQHVYSNGHICLNILGDDWSPALTGKWRK